MRPRAESSSRRIGIFLPSAAHAAMTPSVYHTARLLAEDGYDVDLVVASTPHWRPPVFSDPKVFVYELSVGASPGKRWIPQLVTFVAFTLKVCLLRRYHCLVGVDRNGLISATILSGWKHSPVVYYSLEIEFLNPPATLAARMKKALERWCHRRAAVTLTQDNCRAGLLLRENRLPDARVLILPNAPAGPPREGQRGDYWEKKFGIPRDRVIILHAGGIAETNCVPELARVAHSWPEDWVLVLHGYGEESSIDHVRPFVDHRHVFLSLDTVPIEQLDEIVGSATIGIALYDASYGPNVSRVGLASGKILQYMKCGLPVIASDLPGIRELIVDSGCGAVVSEAGHVEAAVRMTLGDIERHRSRSRECYQKQWSFDQHFEHFLEFLSELGTRG